MFLFKIKYMKTIKNVLICFFCIFSGFCAAQEKPDSDLFIALKKADSLIFDLGFNQCNFDVLEKTVHRDLEFLHDQGGIQNREEFFKAIRENICNPASVAKPVRKLTPGTLVVYPLKKDGEIYGAIQLGEHEFYLAEKSKPLRKTATAKFIHTWLLEDGQWKLYRVLSYDHQPVAGSE